MNAFCNCRVCGGPVPISGYLRYFCCDGRDCGCGGGTLPDNVCSSTCLEDEDRLPPLELLEDDEALVQIAEEVRAKREAAGLDPHTGLTHQP